MQIQYNRTSQNIRDFVRLRLKNHPKLNKFAISSHRKYCSFTGFLHILPDYLILGAQKSGTNSLYWYLRQHPFVKRATTKEILFFDKYYDRGLNWYRVCFPLKSQKYFLKNILGKNLLTGEATERYLDHPHAPQRVKESIPNVKFIILLRNPVDRAYSHYNMRFSVGNETLSFEEAIEKEVQRTKGEYEKMLNDENYYSQAYFHHSYLDRGIYVEKIKRWMSIFPKEQFLLIQSEEFLKNTPLIYNKVLKFLNLPKWNLKEYEEVGLAKYKQPKMKDETRKKLIEFFQPHNQKLYEFLGRNFSWDK
jgi:hypothetical protein